MENFVQQMYRMTKSMKKFEFHDCTISIKLNGKFCTLDVPEVWIHGKSRIRLMYEIVKIQ